jgi:hypothetical protein
MLFSLIACSGKIWTPVLRVISQMFYHCATREYLRGKYHCTVDLLFDWFVISCMTTDNFRFYLQNRLIQTSQTGGQRYSDTSPFSIPWCYHRSYYVNVNARYLKSIFLNHQLYYLSVLVGGRIRIQAIKVISWLFYQLCCKRRSLHCSCSLSTFI